MSLGEIKHIEINVKVAYILYEFYFSAVLAFNIITETIKKRNLKQLHVKLIPKDDENVNTSNSKDANSSIPFRSILTEHNEPLNKEKTTKLKEDLVVEHFSDKEYIPLISNYGIQYSDIVSVSPVNKPITEVTENIIDPSFLFNYRYFTNSHNSSSFETDFDYYSPMNQGAFQKFICNYDVQIENDNIFRVTRRLIGTKGATVKKILYDSCSIFKDNSTKLRLRGKGSGYREGLSNQGIIS
jgi:hypothetical protein